MKSLRWEYLGSLWNYADFVPPLLLILIVLLDVFTTSQGKTVRSIRHAMQAFICFGMWVKVFYFLRIFRNTGFFVNMLIRVMYQIKVFGLLYVLILCAFAFTFYSMAPAGWGPMYFLNQTYLIGLGADSMDYGDFPAPTFMHLFYLLGTLTITIIMLNLLIAIISEAYEEVISSQQEANNFERVQLIHDVSDFIDPAKQEALVKPNEYLIRATIAETSAAKEDGEDQEEPGTKADQ